MENIILYSNGCPKCKVIKSKLEALNIKFTQTDNLDELISLGYKTLPLLKINDKILDFKSANDWIEERRRNPNEN